MLFLKRRRRPTSAEKEKFCKIGWVEDEDVDYQGADEHGEVV